MTLGEGKASLVGMDMVSCSKGWYKHLWTRHQTSVLETQAIDQSMPVTALCGWRCLLVVGGCSFLSAVTGALPALVRSYCSVTSGKGGVSELKILDFVLV